MRRVVVRNLAKRGARNSEPFSTEATRTLGKRSKSFSNISVARKSWAARSMANILMLGRDGPARNEAEKPSGA